MHNEQLKRDSLQTTTVRREKSQRSSCNDVKQTNTHTTEHARNW